MKKLLLVCMFLCPLHALADQHLMEFGKGGHLKMLYDQRMRPQSVYLNDKVYIVFNGGTKAGASTKAPSYPMAITYDPKARTFSKSFKLGEGSKDHHDGPVIWADTEEKLHVFYGWHHDLGTHLVSKQPGTIGTSRDDWSIAPAPAPKMSYPWISRIYGNKELVFYRTNQHYSSWTYRITSDNGKTWEGPKNDVIDLDVKGGMDTDWSVYTAKAISRDGNYLHVGFISYDDYKRPRSPEEIASGKLDKSRLINPLYNHKTSNYKYNLYYIKIDLRTHKVMNYKGEVIQTPIDISTANSKCMIWDTKWRGSGIVPYIIVDENDQPSFLRLISSFQSDKSLDYYYVWLENGEWKHTRVTHSNHHWNGSYLAKSADGVLHAYVITGKGYFESDGEMDRHGGGNLEEWTSADKGNTWTKARDLTPDRNKYPGWRFNNPQPVVRPDGNVVDGMLLFYGWKDKNAPDARAFLLLDDGNK